MHTSLSKKLLAGLLSLVMVLSLVAPSMGTQAASKYSLTDKKSVKSDVTYKYQLKGVSKNQYVKVTRNVSGETVKYNKKAVSKTTKIKGTGKTLNLYVTYGEKEENYTGKITVKIYSNKTKKVVKTIVEKVTVKVPEKEEPEEPVEEETALVSLEATGSKELTATLSKEATVAAADVVVKKGTVVVTPADVKSEGTKVVITLGSKITEGTYSATYKEKTVEVKTEDEKLVELKTVGTSLAQTADTDLTTATGKDGDASTLNAEIEYQALNQYGEAMAADITNVTSTFGGKANFTEPTSKKNGVISIVNINAALGIVGTAGKVIIIAKNGVSTSNDVTFDEEAKVSKVELVGIYDVAGGAYIEAIPAQKDVSNYKLVIRAYNQYGNVIPYNAYNKKMLQSVSVAQVLTNVTIDGIVNNKLTADSFDEISIKDEECVVLKLKTSDSKKTAAGTFQTIIVGDRFGSVMNQTINVNQISLIKNFTMSAADSVYNKDENTLEYTAVDTEGKEVKDYDTLTKLVRFANPTVFYFVKNSDGTAKLVCKPNESMNTTNDNKRETTVISETVTCNDLISAADTVVVPKTLTVSEDKVPTSIVKFTGSTATTENNITLKKSKFVFEDQYGNTLKTTDACYSSIKYDYKFGDNAIAADQSGDLKFRVTTEPTKLYISIANQSNINSDTDTFDPNKAQLVVKLAKVSSSKATNLSAEWWGDGDQLQVTANQAASGINTSMFRLKGTIDGKTVVLPETQYSIKSETYEPITVAEAETAVKKSTVTFTVLLTDVDGKEYTEEVKCDYEYSAAPRKVWAIYTVNTQIYAKDAVIKSGMIATKKITNGELKDLFYVVDQYGTPLGTSDLTLEVSLGKHTDKWVVNKNNTSSAEIELGAGYDVPSASDVSEFSVMATLRNGKTATEKVYVNGEAEAYNVASKKTEVEAKISAANTAYGNLDDTVANWKTFKNAYDAAAKAVDEYVARGGLKKDLTKFTFTAAQLEEVLAQGEVLVDSITLTEANKQVDNTLETYTISTTVLVTFANGDTLLVKANDSHLSLSDNSSDVEYDVSKLPVITWTKGAGTKDKRAVVTFTYTDEYSNTAVANFTLTTDAK